MPAVYASLFPVIFLRRAACVHDFIMRGDGVPTANCVAVRSAAGISGAISSTGFVSIGSQAVGDRWTYSCRLLRGSRWGVRAPVQVLRIPLRGPTHLDRTTLAPLVPNMAVTWVEWDYCFCTRSETALLCTALGVRGI